MKVFFYKNKSYVLFKENIYSKKLDQNELIEVKNNFYGENDDRKKYQAVIFSISASKIEKQYKIQINEGNESEGKEVKKDDVKKKRVLSIPILVFIIIFVIIIIIILIIMKKKKKNNKKNNKKKYIENTNTNNELELFTIDGDKK